MVNIEIKKINYDNLAYNLGEKLLLIDDSWTVSIMNFFEKYCKIFHKNINIEQLFYSENEDYILANTLKYLSKNPYFYNKLFNRLYGITNDFSDLYMELDNVKGAKNIFNGICKILEANDFNDLSEHTNYLLYIQDEDEDMWDEMLAKFKSFLKKQNQKQIVGMCVCLLNYTDN